MRALPIALLALVLAAPRPARAQGDEGMRPAAAAAAAGDGQDQADRADDLEARLTRVEGPVYVRLSGRPDDAYVPGEAEMPIAAGDEIRTGEGAMAELTIEGEAVVHLGANSDFVVNSLAPKDTELFLGLGSLVAKIKKLAAGRRLGFRTPTATAAVRGTELGVSHGEGDEAALIGVFDEGRVSVTGHSGEGETELGPNQEARVAAGRPIAPPARLKFWHGRRDRMAKARAGLESARKRWKARPFAQRAQARGQLLNRPGLERGRLQGLSPEQGKRRYEELRQRQQQLRETRRRAREQRRDGVKQEREQRRGKIRDQREQKRKSRPRRGDRERRP